MDTFSLIVYFPSSSLFFSWSWLRLQSSQSSLGLWCPSRCQWPPPSRMPLYVPRRHTDEMVWNQLLFSLWLLYLGFQKSVFDICWQIHQFLKEKIRVPFTGEWNLVHLLFWEIFFTLFLIGRLFVVFSRSHLLQLYISKQSVNILIQKFYT